MNHLATLACLLVLSTAAPAADEFDTTGFDFDIADGPFQPERDSFGKHYRCPDWFRDAKFGIYMHWGLGSVPGFDGHYARFMYHQQTPEAYTVDRASGRRPLSGWKPGRETVYQYHLENFGHPSQFGYKDFIPLFKAEKFDALELTRFYKEIGAKFIGVMAVHHDNFDLYDSTHQPWNSVRMGRSCTGMMTGRARFDRSPAAWMWLWSMWARPCSRAPFPRWPTAGDWSPVAQPPACAPTFF